MQPAVMEWNELTSRNKIYFLLLTILPTHPMFSGVYGKIDHILNGIDHRALKKTHRIGIGDARHRDRRRTASGSGQHGIGGSWRISEESVLNSLSALSICTTIAQLSQTFEVAV
jgi:hypothetical protein